MAKAKTQQRRCATYTRKSSEEGLEQDFNSLDAQREACEAYIRSQVGEGWKRIRTHYDDGGYSGGTLDRPALGQLLADIEAGKIDTVVVYKVDRLTRSLTDFSKIVEILDAHEVSFVSVTQQFNTTTSMGRLTLNMLLSFAQFEREVTGERIRDKIAASKRRGLWMGGNVPLGYEPDGRTLTIVDSEAKTVRKLFQLYLEMGSVRLAKKEADRIGIKSKVRRSEDGRTRGGLPLSRGNIYRMLGNPLYIGRIRHKGDTYDGQHPGIIDRETWDAVQKRLADQTPTQSTRTSRSNHSPLRGKLFDEAGVLLTPSHAVKSGRRYRYYVSRAFTTGETANDTKDGNSRWRLPAQEIEQFVAKAITRLFANQAELACLAREAKVHEGRISDLLERVGRWKGRPLEVVQRIDLGAKKVSVYVDLSCFLDGDDTVIRCVIRASLRRRGVEKRLVLYENEKGSNNARVDATLVKAIVRARRWFEDLSSGRARSLEDIGVSEGVGYRYVGSLMPLAFLAPDIVARILSGTQPVELTTEMLMKHMDLPLAWTEQMKLLDLD